MKKLIVIFLISFFLSNSSMAYVYEPDYDKAKSQYNKIIKEELTKKLGYSNFELFETPSRTRFSEKVGESFSFMLCIVTLPIGIGVMWLAGGGPWFQWNHIGEAPEQLSSRMQASSKKLVILARGNSKMEKELMEQALEQVNSSSVKGLNLVYIGKDKNHLIETMCKSKGINFELVEN